MDLSSDFIKEDLVEINIEGRTFKYKPANAGEETEWLNEYMYEENGIIKQDYARSNKCRLRNIMEVPYTKETIKTTLGIEQGWKELNLENRWNLLSKLRPTILRKLIKEMNKIDDALDEEKKT